MRRGLRLLAPLGLTLAALGASAGAEWPAAPTDSDYAHFPEGDVALGRLLFYDPILSGNRNIACATCHHPAFATGDGVSLGLGEGGIGLGPDRRPDPDDMPEQRVPRNAPPLFNLGAHEFTRLFDDGRIEKDPSRPSGFRTPLGQDMMHGFDSVLSAQTMFPVLAQDEMAGHYSENDVSKAVRQGRITGKGGAWDLIARRVAAIPAYAARFKAVFPGIEAPGDIAFTDISNAIAAFIATEWRSDSSPFDAFLRGTGTLAPLAREGAGLFYGDAGCSTCHLGAFQTDQQFHAMGAMQLGPGRVARFEHGAQDVGRMRVTGRKEDAYAFRTPPLRNVTRTGPWGHAGAQSDLGTFIRHHTGQETVWNRDGAILPEFDADDWRIADDPEERARIENAREWRTTLSDHQIDAILAFLETLEDPVALKGRLGIPDAVPSGLPVDRMPVSR